MDVTNNDQPEGVVTPINANNLDLVLEGYDISLREEIVSGFRWGFDLHCEADEYDMALPVEASNLKSAYELPDIIDRKIEQEIELGRIAGPYGEKPFSNLILSPIGVVEKKEPGQYRMIQHLSHPKGNSVNDAIPDEICTVHYACVQDAVRLAKEKGAQWMAKTDVKSAFRIVPVRPDQHHLLGFSWRDEFYYDRCLPMGCSVSCMIFEKISTALEWVATVKLGIDLVHVLDDFLILSKSEATCQRNLDRFLALCKFVGVPMAPEKTFRPAKVMEFLGITIDLIRGELRLPVDKVEKCRTLCGELMGRSKTRLRELLSVIGLLNFATSVVIPGRPFLRRLQDLTIGIREPYHYVRINKEAKADLAAWLNFLEQFNGVSNFRDDRWLSSAKLVFYTDASRLGYGAIFESEWFYGSWPEQWKGLPIALLEFFPIMVAVRVWGHRLRGKSVIFFTDNESVVSIINRQTSKNVQIMKMVRDFVISCLSQDVLFHARHVPGKFNRFADMLSRLQVTQFLAVAPTMQRIPATVPHNLRPVNWSLISGN